MSNINKYYDNTPFIKAAGSITSLSGVSADNSIRQELYFQPSTHTPDHILKYCNSLKERPGVKQYHPGIFNDPKDYEEFIHGNCTPDSLHVPDCMSQNNMSGNQMFMKQLEEQHYASAKREPLGKSIQRDYVFPDQVKDPNFQFGVPTTGLLNAKELMYDGCLLNETPETKKLYEKTHGITDPGQQKDRNYHLNFDKNNHMYGFAEEKEYDGTKKSLSTDTLQNPYPSTIIVDKRLEDFRQANNDMLGRSKYRGTLHPLLDDTHTFGKTQNLDGNWNAAKCIHGDAKTMNDHRLAPDIDLGKDSHYKEKILGKKPIEYDPNKVFGVPSIRDDLPKKKLVSVTDVNNYGNEKDAFELLYPHPCATRGLDDEHFDKLLTKEQIKGFLDKMKIAIPPEEFNLIYQIALKNYPNSNQKLSSNGFIATMKNLKREYMKYRTLF